MSLNEKHGTIVAMSRQYPFGNDKAVQISRTACCHKGTQLQYFKPKSPYYSGHQILILPGCFGFKLSEEFSNALRFNHTQLEKNVSLKWPSNFEHENRK